MRVVLYLPLRLRCALSASDASWMISDGLIISGFDPDESMISMTSVGLMISNPFWMISGLDSDDFEYGEGV